MNSIAQINELSGDLADIIVRDKPIDDLSALDIMRQRQIKDEISRNVNAEIAAHEPYVRKEKQAEPNRPSWLGVTTMTIIAMFIGFILGVGL